MSYSIIVTVYNDEQFLTKCFDAITKQTIKPIEIIVVDDNSTDNSSQIIEKYNFTKIFSDEPKHKDRWLNRVRAFKLGLKSLTVQTDLILKIDSDIIIPPDYSEKLIKHFKNESILAAASGVQDQNRFHPLPRNGAIIYQKKAIDNIKKIKEVYAWDRWILLTFLEKGYILFVDDSITYTELRTSILSNKEAFKAGTVRRREHYPLNVVLKQALFQGGFKSLYFIYGYLTGAGPERHSRDFIREYIKNEEKERMKYIRKHLEAEK